MIDEKSFAVQIKGSNNKSIINNKTTKNIPVNLKTVGHNKLTSYTNKRKIAQVTRNIAINNNR